MSRIRIVSDGTPNGTRVENADTGEEIESVVAIMWKVDVDKAVAEAVCTFELCAADVVGDGLIGTIGTTSEEPTNA